MTSEHSLVAVNLPHVGLGNRIRFTLSSQAVARSENCRFSYVWPVGRFFHAQFTDLWHYPERQLEKPPVGEVVKNPQTSISPLLKESSLIVRGQSIMTGSGSEESWESLLRKLTPTAEVRERVRDLIARSGLGEDYVAVQIRAHKHSHEFTKEASPLEWYVDRMRELSAHRSVRFFVSADTRSAQRVILRLFPTAVALPQAHGYNSRRALIKAVADLYLLAGGTLILAPYWSSFAELAWALSGRSQDLEDSKSTRPAAAPSKRPEWASLFSM